MSTTKNSKFKTLGSLTRLDFKSHTKYITIYLFEQVKLAMRTAAETLLVEEERNKEIIQAEKDLTYPKRAVAAALSLQKMYCGWKAVQAVRQVAFQVYLKHFDPNYHKYYWENTRLGTTSWR